MRYLWQIKLWFVRKWKLNRYILRDARFILVLNQVHYCLLSLVICSKCEFRCVNQTWCTRKIFFIIVISEYFFMVIRIFRYVHLILEIVDLTYRGIRVSIRIGHYYENESIFNIIWIFNAWLCLINKKRMNVKYAILLNLFHEILYLPEHR